MSEPTASPRVRGTVVCLPSRDLDASLAFYSGVFGLADLAIDEGMFVVELPNLSLFVMAENEFEVYSRKAGRTVTFPSDGIGAILSCAITSREQVDEMLDAASTRGGRVLNPAQFDAELSLYLGYCSDPDGHQWELAFSE